MAYGRIFAKKVKYDGYTFDSEMECLYYKELKEREKKRQVTDIRVHPSYVLQKEFYANNGKKHKAITYEPDFVFFDIELGRWRYVDVKGMLLPEFEIKWKMFDKLLKLLKEEYMSDLSYLEVLKYSKTTGFVPIEDYKKIMKTRKQQILEERNYYKNIVLKQEHEKELAYKKKQREIERLKVLLSLTKLTSAQSKRLKELQEKYPDAK